MEKETATKDKWKGEDHTDTLLYVDRLVNGQHQHLNDGVTEINLDELNRYLEGWTIADICVLKEPREIAKYTGFLPGPGDDNPIIILRARKDSSRRSVYFVCHFPDPALKDRGVKDIDIYVRDKWDS